MSSKPIKYTDLDPGTLVRAVAFCNPTGRIRMDDAHTVQTIETECMEELMSDVCGKPLTDWLVGSVKETLRILANRLVYLGLCRIAPVPFVGVQDGPYGARFKIRWREAGVVPA